MKRTLLDYLEDMQASALEVLDFTRRSRRCSPRKGRVSVPSVRKTGRKEE